MPDKNIYGQIQTPIGDIADKEYVIISINTFNSVIELKSSGSERTFSIPLYDFDCILRESESSFFLCFKNSESIIKLCFERANLIYFDDFRSALFPLVNRARICKYFQDKIDAIGCFFESKPDLREKYLDKWRLVEPVAVYNVFMEAAGALLRSDKLFYRTALRPRSIEIGTRNILARMFLELGILENDEKTVAVSKEYLTVFIEWFSFDMFIELLSPWFPQDCYPLYFFIRERIHTAEDVEHLQLLINRCKRILVALVPFENLEHLTFKDKKPSELLRDLYEESFDLIRNYELELQQKEQAKKNADFQKLKTIDFDRITGTDFESFCAVLLEKEEFENVTVTRSSHDQGIDILAEKNGEKYAIQCKCYASAVGIQAIQEAFSGASYYDCEYAVVMTNSKFSRSAKELADKIGVTLWDRPIIKAMIDN